MDTLKERKKMKSSKFRVVVTLGERREEDYDQGGLQWPSTELIYFFNLWGGNLTAHHRILIPFLDA